MDQKIVEIMKNARKPIVQNAKAGDHVLIVADTWTDPLVWQALSAAALEVGAEPTVTIMTTRKGDGFDPTLPAAEAIRGADVIIYATYTSLAHSPLPHKIRRELQGDGKVRTTVLMEQITPDMLLGGAVEEDPDWMWAVGDRIQAAMRGTKTIRVTSEYGTDVRASVDGAHGFTTAGKIRPRPGSPGGGEMAFPDGESNVMPIAGTGEGVIVWDLSAHHVGMLTEPIRMTVHEGKVVKFEGGSQAKELERFIAEQNDPNCYCAPAEVALGLNRKVIPCGLMRSDKKIYGGIHMAVGSSGTIKGGGSVQAKLHLDGVMRAPRVVLDDKIVLCDGGKILV